MYDKKRWYRPLIVSIRVAVAQVPARTFSARRVAAGTSCQVVMPHMAHICALTDPLTTCGTSRVPPKFPRPTK